MPLTSVVLREGHREYHSDIPLELLTGTGAEPRPRLRVDVGQTGFWEGRMFRAFVEFNIGAGATQVLRFTADSDFIIHKQTLSIEDGQLRFSAVLGGTPGGVFTDLGTIGMNRMANRPAPEFLSGNLLASGGTHTGGTEVEVIRLRTSNSTAQSTTAARGLPSGVYYLRLQNLGAGPCVGVYALEWEEWRARSEVIYG